MKVIVEKSDGKKFDFLIDKQYEFMLDLCSFHKDNFGYINTIVNKKNMIIFSNYDYKLYQHVKLHRILFELHTNRKLEKGEVIDHMDICKTNNKIVNLRAFTQSENCKNRKLKKDQVYYNIWYDKYHNYFQFRHREQEKNVSKYFRSLHEALIFFIEYDKKNDYVLTKHINNIKPIDGIENIVLTPDGKCDKCGTSTWSKSKLKLHQKNSCSN